MNNPLVQPDPGLFIWTILTFLVLLFLLAKYAWKPLLSMLEKREAMIRNSLDDAEKAKVELERLQQESEKIIAAARAEAQTIVNNGKTTAEKLKDDILQKAKEKSDSIVSNAMKQIETEKNQALLEIKTEVADISIRVASKLIGKNLTREDNRALIEKSLKNINQRHEA